MKRTSTNSLTAFAALFVFAGQINALTITPTFDKSISNNANAAAMEAAINLAIAEEQSVIGNPVNVSILFRNVNTGLGASNSSYDNLSYTQYRTDLLTSQILSANDVTALATLSAGPNNPANGNANMHLNLPLLRAIGESVLGDNGGGYDSTIDLNMSQTNYLRTGPQNPAKVDLQQVAMHEIEEVLGVGGAGSTLGGSDAAAGSLDLFRYSAAGVRSYSTKAGTTSYFSIDAGTTNLSFFNQTAGGDYADWDGTANGTLQVQDAFSPGGNQLDLSNAEKISLDVVGWNIVPEPSAVLLLLSTGALCMLRRPRPRQRQV